MIRTAYSSLPSAALLILAASNLVGCASSLGPGYSVVNQEIHVVFRPQPTPRILVDVDYHLKNIGNQALESLNVRLPGRRFDPAGSAISWDGSALSPTVSSDNPRDTLLRFSDRWTIGASHTLHISYEIISSKDDDGPFGISQDAFYLPAEAWAPQLPQPRGVFGFGGVPPKRWDLRVQVPQEFLIHASGGEPRQAKKGAEIEYVFRQSSEDLAPFVVAGRYREFRQDLAQNQQIHIWSRAQLDLARIQKESESFATSLATYDSLFGAARSTGGHCGSSSARLISAVAPGVHRATQICCSETSPRRRPK